MSLLRFGTGAAAGVVVGSMLRRLSLHTGATESEAHGSLPGDDVIAHPKIEWTRAATIRATPDRIWPWLVQMGYGRGGWYTNERFDQLVWRVSADNAPRILDEYQHLAVGDIVADGPQHAAYFHVREILPGRAIVYHSIRHPYRGHPIDVTRDGAVDEIEEWLVRSGTYLDFSWAFVLQAIGTDRTRLIIRTRANYGQGWIRFLEVPLGLVDVFHAHTILGSLRRRSESNSMAPRSVRPIP